MSNPTEEFIEKEVVLTISVPKDFDREDERNLDDEFAAILEKQGWELVHSQEYRNVSEQALTPVNRVTITRERSSENERWSDNFWVDASKTPSVELFKTAVESFLKSPDGTAAIEATCDDFNWGDAMIYVPVEVWHAHGIYPFDSHLTAQEMGLSPTSSECAYSFLVDQDEILIPDHEDSTTITPVKTLPDGWIWVDYSDGSGSLRDPSGKSHFCYDLLPYSSLDSIEYRQDIESEWSIFPGNLDQFKNHAEQCTTQKLHKQSLSLGNHYIAGIMREVANNAWYCEEPTTVYISAGEHKIVMEGYTYEPSYECFSATASISLDGTVLYGIDSENVGPYHNEVCQIGSFESLEEAISHIKEQTKGCQYILQSSKTFSFQERLKNAENRSRDASSNPSIALHPER